MIRTILATIFVAGLMAATPAMADEDAEVLIVNGRGTLSLNSAAAVSFQNYFHQKCPLIMAAHESGAWVEWISGPDENCATGAVDYRRFIPAVLANCEGGHRYGECWIVAIGEKVVWEGRIKARKGRWTPRSSRQFSVALAGEDAHATNGVSTWEAIGMLNYSRDRKRAEIVFKKHRTLGRCKGTLTVVAGAPSPYTVTCSKMGQMTGMLRFDPDGETGTGPGSAKDARHIDLTILPHLNLPSGKKVAQQDANQPRS
jgi:hypothetical protein